MEDYSRISFDYHRTIIGYHGTTREIARRLVRGDPFTESANDDDWLGHGIYFWEYAPKQAWWWAQRRFGSRRAAVVGAMIRLGACLDLLDPANIQVIKAAQRRLIADLREQKLRAPGNANNHKYLDCAVFNFLFAEMKASNLSYDTVRGVFVPMMQGKLPRVWKRSGVFEGGHLQVSVRSPQNIVAAWSVRRDGSYGEDQYSSRTRSHSARGDRADAPSSKVRPA